MYTFLDGSESSRIFCELHRIFSEPLRGEEKYNQQTKCLHILYISTIQYMFNHPVLTVYMMGRADVFFWIKNLHPLYFLGSRDLPRILLGRSHIEVCLIE